jgi:hypothetical protein
MLKTNGMYFRSGRSAFRDNRIARERFFFDLSELCAQSGVSTDAVRRKIFGDAAARQQAAE